MLFWFVYFQGSIGSVTMSPGCSIPSPSHTSTVEGEVLEVSGNLPKAASTPSICSNQDIGKSLYPGNNEMCQHLQLQLAQNKTMAGHIKIVTTELVLSSRHTFIMIPVRQRQVVSTLYKMKVV